MQRYGILFLKMPEIIEENSANNNYGIILDRCNQILIIFRVLLVK
jgi:hypothetical protein